MTTVEVEPLGRLVKCVALDCMPCDQWFWVGRQERPHLLKFPTHCRVHGPVEEID